LAIAQILNFQGFSLPSKLRFDHQSQKKIKNHPDIFNKDLRFLTSSDISGRSPLLYKTSTRRPRSVRKVSAIMSFLPNLLRSLLLTSLLCFAAPLLILGGLLCSLSALSHIPILQNIADSSMVPIWSFLETFGSGQPLDGMFTIGLTCSLVGTLFDAYAFYRYQTLRGH
jgi:hypothetical protein